MSAIYLPNILVVGPSGSGKSTSYRNCPPRDTFLIDIERKGYPFDIRPWVEAGTIETPGSIGEVHAAILKAEASPCSVCIIDSGSAFLDISRDAAKAAKTGWDIWNQYNDDFTKLIKKMKSRSKIWVMLGHDEHLKVMQPDGTERSKFRFTIQGKQWEGKVEKEFLVVLWSDIKNVNGKLQHVFITAPDGVTSSKAPMPLKLASPMDNDLNEVIKKIKEYYGFTPTPAK